MSDLSEHEQDERTIADEIAEMSDSLVDDAITNEQVEEASEEVVDETPTEEPEPVAEEEVEEEQTEEVTDEETSDTERPVDPELERLRTENAEFKSRLDRLESRGKEEEVEEETEEDQIEDVNFIGDDEDIFDTIQSPEGLNALLNKVYKRGVEDALGRADKKITKIPDVIRSEQAERERLASRTNKFYEDNPDLKEWKKTVGAVFNELHMADPNKSEEDLLSELPDAVRSRIGIKGKPVVNSADDEEDTPPPLPKKKGQRRPAAEPKLTPLEAEIDAMNKTLNY